jgi:hypothetical protein
MGRLPIGERAMTEAERQRRHRARLRNSRPWLAEQERRVKARLARLQRQLADIKAAKRRVSAHRGK